MFERSRVRSQPELQGSMLHGKWKQERKRDLHLNHVQSHPPPPLLGRLPSWGEGCTKARETGAYSNQCSKHSPSWGTGKEEESKVLTIELTGRRPGKIRVQLKIHTRNNFVDSRIRELKSHSSPTNMQKTQDICSGWPASVQITA